MLQYLVAEDFFAACGEEPKRMMPAVISAVKVGPQHTLPRPLSISVSRSLAAGIASRMREAVVRDNLQ